jgi:hypothetical protein
VYSNATTATLNISAGVTTAYNGYQYQCVATNTAGNATSNTATLTVTAANVAPSITGPTALSLQEGYAATSSGVFTASGTPAPTVTKTSGNDAITWNNSTKKLDIAAGLAAGSYPVGLKASNGVNPNATITFTLTVTQIPVTNAQTPNITVQPKATTTYDQNATAAPLTVTASVGDGGTLSYQWYSNSINSYTGGKVLTGSNGFSYTPPTSAIGTTYYYVAVTNTNNGVNGTKTATETSEVAEVIVKAKDTGIDDVRQAGQLIAWVQDGILNVSGLVQSKQWSVYHISGTLVRSGVANGDKVEIRLPVRGVYVVRSEDRAAKVVF